MQKMIKNRIKEYRARFDMKQEKLASKVGVCRETIRNLENLSAVTRLLYDYANNERYLA